MALRTLTYEEALANKEQYLPTLLGGTLQNPSLVPGQAITLTYSFTPTYHFGLNARVGVDAGLRFTDFEQQEIKTTLANISQFVNITFVESSNPTDANIYLYKRDLISQGDVYGYGGGYWIDGVYRSEAVMEVTNYMRVNNYLFMHELGHALGLFHPFEGNYTLDSDINHRDNTLMSYTWGPTGSYHTNYQPLDLIALQHLYGGKGDPDGTTGWESASRVTSEGRDYLIGDAGNNDIRGGAGSDHLEGGAGNDTLFGGYAVADPGDAADTLYGGDGDDLLYGNGGDDFLYGDAGNDTLWGGIGADALHGGDGNDYLAGGGAVAHPQDQADSISGGNGNDYILGNGGNDHLYGDGGNDTIYGGVGEDIIYGGAGDDVIYGQIGNDQLFGGAGRDIFVFQANDGIDTIHDFVRGEDKIAIESSLTFLNQGNIADYIRYSSDSTLVGLNADFTQYVRVTGVQLDASDVIFL